MNRRRALSPFHPRAPGSTLSPQVLTYPVDGPSNDVTPPLHRRDISNNQRTPVVWTSDLTSDGVREKGWGGVGDRPAARNGDVRRCTSYNETCVLFFAKKSVLCRADDRRTTSARRLIYVFFLPKLNDGFGSELGSGEIWNAEKA